MEEKLFNAISTLIESRTDGVVYESEDITISVTQDHTVDKFVQYEVVFLGTYSATVSLDFEDDYEEYFYESNNQEKYRYIPIGKCLEIIKKKTNERNL